MKEDILKQILSEIKKYSKLTSLSVNEIRIIFALEGIVRRLQSHNKLKSCLVYKGGFVLMKSYLSDRFTRDLDALAENISRSEIVN